MFVADVDGELTGPGRRYHGVPIAEGGRHIGADGAAGADDENHLRYLHLCSGRGQGGVAAGFVSVELHPGVTRGVSVREGIGRVEDELVDEVIQHRPETLG